MVLEDRIFRKTVDGRSAVEAAYDQAAGVLRGLGELAKPAQNLPDCSRDRFQSFYPFFPYQIHLIPEIVKNLRTSGGHGEQLAGSTRTLLAITQDILRVGRRGYLGSNVGELVSFDEVYHNLASKAEVTPDVRRELSRIEEVVQDSCQLTRRVAEVIYLIGQVSYVPRTIDNLARLLVESTDDDLPTILRRVEPEIDKLVKAKLVARIGDEYEFLTGERRTFEDTVATETSQMRHHKVRTDFTKNFVYDSDNRANHFAAVLGFEKVPYRGFEFPVQISVDGAFAIRNGDIEIRIASPLAALDGTKVPDLEDQSLRHEERYTIFILCDRIPSFDQDVRRYLAMRSVIDSWIGDPLKSEDARRLASERKANDLEKLKRRVQDGIRQGLKQGHVIFKGSARAIRIHAGQAPGDALKAELAAFWPTLYSKFDKVPVRIAHE